MAHELTHRQNGFVEFAYLNSDGAAWHGLGQAVQDGATVEQWIAAAGMDWRIQRGIVRYNVDREGTQLEMPDQHVLFRSDSKAPLGVVSKGYKVVQPAEVLEFFRSIAASQGIEITAAGTLFGGRRFWATAKIDEASPVSTKDRIGGYLLLSSSADGSLSTEARWTSIRVVCNNTLGAARAEGKAAVKVTHRTAFDADDVKAKLGLTTSSWEKFKADMKRLAEVQVSTQEAEDLMARLIGKANGVDSDKARERRDFREVIRLFEGGAKGSDLPGVRETAYGLLQATTEYVDHHARATSADNRFASALWGPGAGLKDTVYAGLLDLAVEQDAGREFAALLAR